MRTTMMSSLRLSELRNLVTPIYLVFDFSASLAGNDIKQSECLDHYHGWIYTLCLLVSCEFLNQDGMNLLLK